MSSYDTITPTLSHADAGQPLQCQIQLGREDGTNVLLSMMEVAHLHVSHGGHPLEHGGARNEPGRSASSDFLRRNGKQIVQGSVWAWHAYGANVLVVRPSRRGCTPRDEFAKSCSPEATAGFSSSLKRRWMRSARSRALHDTVGGALVLPPSHPIREAATPLHGAVHLYLQA